MFRHRRLAHRRRGWLVRRALFLADVVGIVVGVTAATLLARGSAWYTP